MEEKTYSINEIFYSLQGEGRWAGRAAIFIRFSGCNLHCPFCDTDFKSHKSMTMPEIIETLKQWKDCHFVVLTGGEPTLQVTVGFIDQLHAEGYWVAMETNGTHQYPFNTDWVTVSPKTAYVENGQVRISRANEVKVVYDGKNTPEAFGIRAEEYYVQPCDVGEPARNAQIISQCVEWIKENPSWKLSLQQQKILNVR